MTRRHKLDIVTWDRTKSNCEKTKIWRNVDEHFKKVFENKDYGEYFIYLIGSLIKKNLSIKEVGYICETRLHGYSKTGSGIIKFIIRGIPYIKAAFYKGDR